MTLRPGQRCTGWKPVSVAAAAFVLFLILSPARAALVLTLNGTPYADNGGDDSDVTIGRIVTNQTISGFGVSIDIGTSNSPGSATAGILQINSLDIRNSTAGTASLVIGLSDTDFTSPGTGGSFMRLQNSIGGTFTEAVLGDSVVFQSFADPANGQPASTISTSTLTFLKTDASLTTEAFSGFNGVNWVRGAGAYSLANAATITLSAGGEINISGSTTATAPEPGAALAGIAALAMLIRRSKNKLA